MEQIDVARDLLDSYLADFQGLYSLRFMSVNVHQLCHLCDVVLNLGPLWVYSVFFLEDLNGGISRLVHGSRHAAMQISSSVSAFLTLPVRLNELNHHNPIRLFCERLLTSGQTQIKIAYDISPNLQVAGGYAVCDPVPQLIANALATSFNVVNGRCSYFYKLRKMGVLYVAANYRRDLQKVSCYVVITKDSIPYLCKITNFVRWTPCDAQCEQECNRCPARFFCIVELYEREVWEAHHTPNVRLSYLNKVLPTGIVRAFSVQDVSTLCFFMRVDDKYYIACPVNELETE